jgi:hypothetical protein
MFAASVTTNGHVGAMGFADPVASVGYAYITNKMGTRLTGDPRDLALRDAIYSSIRASGASGQRVA